MLTLPLPLVVTLILCYLLLRYSFSGNRSVLFLVLLAVCAIQALVITLTQHYGITALQFVQPITAVVIPPLSWLTFQSAVLRPLAPRRDILHVFGLALTIFCVFSFPLALDVLLPTIFAGYGASILICIFREETLPLARLASGPLPARIWKVIGALLILSALSDISIAIALDLGFTGFRPMIVSVSASLTLLGIGLLSISRDAKGVTEEDSATPEPSIGPSEEDIDMVARLDALIESKSLHLDPDLTLTRLARRLHVPIKQLSAAINKVKGENVSRYVNNFRIHNACTCLSQGETVTKAMLNSGFNTKSNFNREFVRIMGKSPTSFLQSRTIKT